jgi:hypothetical protein
MTPEGTEQGGVWHPARLAAIRTEGRTVDILISVGYFPYISRNCSTLGNSG